MHRHVAVSGAAAALLLSLACGDDRSTSSTDDPVRSAAEATAEQPYTAHVSVEPPIADALNEWDVSPVEDWFWITSDVPPEGDSSVERYESLQPESFRDEGGEYFRQCTASACSEWLFRPFSPFTVTVAGPGTAWPAEFPLAAVRSVGVWDSGDTDGTYRGLYNPAAVLKDLQVDILGYDPENSSTNEDVIAAYEDTTAVITVELSDDGRLSRASYEVAEPLQSDKRVLVIVEFSYPGDLPDNLPF